MLTQQSLRALLDLIDDLQNSQLDLDNHLQNEQFNVLIRQIHNPESGILSESLEQRLKRSLEGRFRNVLEEAEGRLKQESKEMLEAIVSKIKVYPRIEGTNFLSLFANQSIIGEGIRLISSIVTSIFAKGRKQRLRRLLHATDKAEQAVLRDMEAHLAFLANLEEIDIRFAKTIKAIESHLISIENALADVIEALIRMFQKVEPAFIIGDISQLNDRVNVLLQQAELRIFENDEHIQNLEASFENFLFFITTNVLSAKSRMLKVWKMYEESKQIFHMVLIEEVAQFKGADEEKKSAFLEQLRQESQEILDNINLQVKNLDQDFSRKIQLIHF